MSQPDKGVYTASCNPPRRAKRKRTGASEPNTALTPQPPQMEPPVTPPGGTLQPRPILPKRAAPVAQSSSFDSPSPEPLTSPPTVPTKPPSKRGRKPGPLSRSAREAQRRLNHSIIEKARRTKINNALATLKELVPVDYGKKKSQEDNSDSEDDEDEDDGDGDYGGERKKQKAKPSAKKEEKEREYKLEILVRTVAFMQDLLQRVAVLEQANPLCSNCGGGLDTIHTCAKFSIDIPTSPERPGSALNDPDPVVVRPSKRARIDNFNRQPPEPSPPTSLSIASQEASQESVFSRHRLPSISSWLPEPLLDPSIFHVSSPRKEHVRNNEEHVPPLQLPTPPSSTHFEPAVASLGSKSVNTFASSAGSTRQKVSSPVLTRTPEDEHAATMLLQISGSASGSSPTFRLPPPSIISSTEPTPTMLSSLPSSSTRVSQSRDAGRRDSIAVQTPASILGLVTPATN